MKTKLIFLLLLLSLNGFGQKSRCFDPVLHFTAKTTLSCYYNPKIKDWEEWGVPFPVKTKIKIYLVGSDLFLNCDGLYKLVTAITFDQGVDASNDDPYTKVLYEAEDVIGNKHLRIDIYNYTSGEHSIVITKPTKIAVAYFSRKIKKQIK